MNGHAAATEARKSRHLDICLEDDVASTLSSGFEGIRLRHEALPEIALEDVDTSITVLGRRWSAPLLISSMTGGTERAGTINRHLAIAAETAGIALALGSQRAAVENRDLLPTYDVRKVAPKIVLFANIGAVQLNYGLGIDAIRALVAAIAADGLYLHLNPLQEALQSGGDTNFRTLEPKIAALVEALEIPVLVKSVGSGISVATAKRLFDCGVAAVDIAGAGGTSWARVEGKRSESDAHEALAEQFAGWGYATAEATAAVREAFPDRTVFASGGIRSGVDLAKALAIGADAGGAALPFLEPATRSPEAVGEVIAAYLTALRIAMFASGCRRVDDLRDALQPPRGAGFTRTFEPSTATSKTSTVANAPSVI